MNIGKVLFLFYFFLFLFLTFLMENFLVLNFKKFTRNNKQQQKQNSKSTNTHKINSVSTVLCLFLLKFVYKQIYTHSGALNVTLYEEIIGTLEMCIIF